MKASMDFVGVCERERTSSGFMGVDLYHSHLLPKLIDAIKEKRSSRPRHSAWALTDD